MIELLYTALECPIPPLIFLGVIGFGFTLTLCVTLALAINPAAHARCYPNGRAMSDWTWRAFRAANTASWGCLTFALAVHWGDVYWQLTPGNTPPALTLLTRLGGIGASWWALTSILSIRRDGDDQAAPTP